MPSHSLILFLSIYTLDMIVIVSGHVVACASFAHDIKPPSHMISLWGYYSKHGAGGGGGKTLIMCRDFLIYVRLNYSFFNNAR